MKETIIILKKELLEIFRDKSTFVILFIPLLIFPLFNFGMGFFNANSKTDVDISFNCASKEAEIIINQFVQGNDTFNFNVVNSGSPKELLKKGDIDCYVIEVNKKLDFIYDSQSFSSLTIATKLVENFQQFYNSAMYKSHKDILKINLKNESGRISNAVDSITSIFVPIVLVTMVFQGTSGFANDLFAGEKERKTLEILLLSGAKKKAIYCGKALSLVILSLLNLSICLFSYFFSLNFSESGINQFGFIRNGNALLNALSIVTILIELSFVAVFISVTVSMLSKNMKNSQLLNELLLVLPAGTMALVVFGVIKSEVVFMNYIPIVNLLVHLNNSFAGNLNLISVGISLMINVVFIIAIILFSAKYMKSEKFIS